MPIIGAYILPHGALSLTPFKYPELKELVLIHKSCCDISDEIKYSNPDLIVLTTPHGISLNTSFGVYLNSVAEGSAEWQGEWSEYKVKVEIDINHSKDFLNRIKIANIPSEGIVGYSDDMPIPIRWGEVIPIWFISQPYYNYSIKPIALPKFVFLSLPRIRLTEPELLVNDCLKLGKEIFEYFNLLDKKVIVITSADLAHTHDKSRLNTVEDEADLFDKSIELWATNPNENENVLLECSKIVTKYKSCGYLGIVILQGVLRQLKDIKEIKSEVLCNEHPTYFGMMVAKFN